MKVFVIGSVASVAIGFDRGRWRFADAMWAYTPTCIDRTQDGSIG